MFRDFGQALSWHRRRLRLKQPYWNESISKSAVAATRFCTGLNHPLVGDNMIRAFAPNWLDIGFLPSYGWIQDPANAIMLKI
jgi:hypothetical protein